LKARFLCLLMLALPAVAKTPAQKLECAKAAGVTTIAEVVPAPSQNAYTVNVTFVGKRPSNFEIDKVLRDCIKAAARRDGTKDIVGSPWLRKRAKSNPLDDDLLKPYGDLKFLGYVAATKSIDIREPQLKLK
jgi:hypothetical protein